jgi:predicted ABC-type ATPase
MKTFTVIGGVNGAGKSSMTGVLKAERNDLGCVIDVDKIAADNKCSPIQANKKALAKINEFLKGGISFSQESTLSGQQIEKAVRTAYERGYIIHLFYVGINTCEESIKRINNRVEKGGHNVKPEDVIRRYGRRFDDLIKILPYTAECHLFDNENGFIEVGEYKNGELIPKGEYKPDWLCELMRSIK